MSLNETASELRRIIFSENPDVVRGPTLEPAIAAATAYLDPPTGQRFWGLGDAPFDLAAESVTKAIAELTSGEATTEIAVVLMAPPAATALSASATDNLRSIFWRLANLREERFSGKLRIRAAEENRRSEESWMRIASAFVHVATAGLPLRAFPAVRISAPDDFALQDAFSRIAAGTLVVHASQPRPTLQILISELRTLPSGEETR